MKPYKNHIEGDTPLENHPLSVANKHIRESPITTETENYIDDALRKTLFAFSAESIDDTGWCVLFPIDSAAGRKIARRHAVQAT